MRTIYKYELTPNGIVADMPRGAEVLTVQVQHGKPCIWAMVDPDAPTHTRHFRVIGTGHRFEADVLRSMYVGTFQLEGGSLVFHVFG
jgi:hypothetical protein